MAEPEERWVSAREAEELISENYRQPALAQRAIIEHVTAKLIATRCRRFLIEEDEQAPTIEHDGVPVPLAFWAAYSDPHLRLHSDWFSGAFAARDRDPSGIGWYRARAFGVEFNLGDLCAVFAVTPPPDPAHTRAVADYRLRKAADAHRTQKIDPAIQGAHGLTVGQATQYFGEVEQTPRKPRANPVSDKEIRAWYRSLTKAQRTLGVLALWDLAREAHPGRHLPRKLVEQFGQGRSNGHRPSA